MRRFEYRIERIQRHHLDSYGDGLLTRLNALAADGWRVAGVAGGSADSLFSSPNDVLLEREVSDMDQLRRLFAPGA